MEVTIKTLTGKSFPLTINPTDTIDAVRRKIEAKEGVPVDHQKLTCSGRALAMSNFRSYGEPLDVDRPLAGLLKLQHDDADGSATVQLYLPQIEVVKKGKSTSWQTRRLISPGMFDPHVEYDAVRTIPAEWRAVAITSETTVRSVMSAIEAEYREKYLPKSLLTAQQAAAREYSCSACTFLNPIASARCEMCNTPGPASATEDSAGEHELSMQEQRGRSDVPVLVDFLRLYTHKKDTMDIKWQQPPTSEDKKIVSLEPPVYWDDEGERRTVADYSFITTGTVIHLVLGLRGD